MSKFRMGDKVLVKGKLHRGTTRNGESVAGMNWSAFTWDPDTEDHPGDIRRDWVPVTYGIYPLTGVVVGLRVLANGVIAEWIDGSDWEPEGYAKLWMPDEYIPAYQVAWDLRSKPDFCLPEQLEPMC